MARTFIASLSSLTLAAASVLALLAAPRSAQACGGTFCDNLPDPMPVDQRGEDILFVVEGGTVEVHIRIEYQGEAERFAWVLPLQAIPEVDVGSEPLFTALYNTTTPRWTRVREYDCQEDDPSWGDTGDGDTGDGDGDGDGDNGGPEIVLQEVVGAFEVVVLQGGTAQEVIDFLDANNYAQDPEAEPIMQEYLDEGFLFAAVKLTAAAEVEEIHPLVFKFAGTEPCVPIRLTRIAAKDNMDIRAYFLGDERWAPSNYAHVVLNPLAYNWNFAGPVGYGNLLNAGVDEAPGGRGFVTEFAGSPAAVDSFAVWSPQWDSSAFIGVDPIAAIDLIALQGLNTHPLIRPLLLEFIPPPMNLDPLDFWNNIDFYADQIDLGAWDSMLFAAALEDRIIAPGLHGYDLLQQSATLTQLHTTMSPFEMTVDPTFHTAPDLPSIGDTSVETVEQVLCGGEDSIFHVMVEGQDYPVCVPGNAAYPLWDMPAALRVEQIPMIGPPQVVIDNTPLVTQMYDEYQAGVECAAVGDGDGDSGDGDSGDGDGDGGGDGDGDGGGTSDGGGDGSTGGPGQDMSSEASCACSSARATPFGFGLGLLVLGLLGPWRRRE